MSLWSWLCGDGSQYIGPSKDDLESAALRALHGKLIRYPRNKADIDEAWAKLREMEAWAKTLSNPNERSAYMGWLSYYADRYRSAEVELRRRASAAKAYEVISRPPA